MQVFKLVADLQMHQSYLSRDPKTDYNTMMKLVVLSCMVAATCASVVVPLAYSSPLAYNAPFAYAASWNLAPYNYRGPLSLAPGQPANILGADGRPLDTLEVNLDKVSKALNNGVHLLKKRSVPFIAPIASIVAPTPLITPASPILSHGSPIANIAPYAAYAGAAPYATYW